MSGEICPSCGRMHQGLGLAEGQCFIVCRYCPTEWCPHCNLAAYAFPSYTTFTSPPSHSLPTLCPNGVHCSNFSAHDLFAHVAYRKKPGIVDPNEPDCSPFRLHDVAKFLDEVVIDDVAPPIVIEGPIPEPTHDDHLVISTALALGAITVEEARKRVGLGPVQPAVWTRSLQWWTGLLNDTRVFLAVGEVVEEAPHTEGAILVASNPLTVWRAAMALGPGLCSRLGGLEAAARSW